jgi:deazaflavin-dependent oxidoreductase (nitroreductase family)
MLPESFWQRIKTVQRIHRRLYDSGRGWIIGWLILLLEHTGRKSGQRYQTPLQYELMDGAYYVGAGRGPKADWYRNILADPHVRVRVSRLAFDCEAEPVTDPSNVADFLAYRLKRRPLMVGLIMRLHHLPMRPSRSQLEALARSLAVVKLCPPSNAFGTSGR